MELNGFFCFHDFFLVLFYIQIHFFLAWGWDGSVGKVLALQAVEFELHLQNLYDSMVGL